MSYLTIALRCIVGRLCGDGCGVGLTASASEVGLQAADQQVSCKVVGNLRLPPCSRGAMTRRPPAVRRGSPEKETGQHEGCVGSVSGITEWLQVPVGPDA